MAAAVGIPLWFHLRAGREPEDLPWAAMQFLRNAFEARKRWLRLRRWALMLLRMLLLALLVLALARLRLPLSPGWPLVDGAGLRMVLVLDDTASVGAVEPESGKSCFQSLQRQAIETVNRYPAAEFAVVFGSKSRAGQWLTPGAARSVLEQAKATAVGGDLPRALSAAHATLDEEQDSDVVFVLSDHQQTAWPARDAAAPAVLARLSAAAKVCMFGISGTLPDNVGIVSLDAEPYPAVAGKEIVLRARLNTSGEADRRSVELYVDQRFVATQVIEVASGDHEASVVFRHVFDEPGVYRIEARLQADSFPVDDSRFLVLDVARDANVLCVSDAGDAVSAAFVRAMLQSAQDSPFAFPPEGFAASCWPDETTVLITANLSAVPTNRMGQLRGFLERGGAWLCFTGPDVHAGSYRSLSDEGLLPVELGAAYGSSPGQAEPADYFQIDTLRMAHPMFDCGETTEFRRALFAEPRFYQAFDIALPQPADEQKETVSPSRVIAWFNNGRNFAIEGRVGKGMVYVFASTADVRWNSLPLTPAYVLVDRAMHHVLENSRPLRGRGVGEPLSADLPGAGWFGELLLPDGSRRPSIDADDLDSPICRWVTTDQAGFYGVEFKKKQAHRESDTITDPYAFNTAADESDLRRATWQEIRDRYPDFDFACEQDSPAPYEVADAAQEGGRLVEISRLLALLALCILVIEAILAAGIGGRQGP